MDDLVDDVFRSVKSVSEYAQDSVNPRSSAYQAVTFVDGREHRGGRGRHHLSGTEHLDPFDRLHGSSSALGRVTIDLRSGRV